jgi:hypothetical protein
LLFALGLTLGPVAAPAQISAPAQPQAATPAPTTTPSPPKFIFLDEQALALGVERVKAGDAFLQSAYKALLARADRALKTAPRTVVDKPRPAPSGDPRDYMSRGPYWWPNPATPDGLPYIRRDGQRNPEAVQGAMDSQRLQDMIGDVLHLALAWRHTGDKRYADKAAQMLRVWFIEPATRMNPHLRYAQGIPGILDGRGIGIIDTRDLWGAIDGAALLVDAGSFSRAEQDQMRGWFREYAQWLRDSDNGREEAAAYNNHGVFYDAQLTGFLLFSGEMVAARRLVLAARTLRVAGQIDKAGRLPFELDRTRPFHYTGFTMQAFTQLARHGQLVERLADTLPADDPRCAHPQWRCPVGLWEGNDEGRSLRAGLLVLAAAVLKPSSLAQPTAVEPTPPYESAVQALLVARHALGDKAFDAALLKLHAQVPHNVHWLLWPMHQRL